jgi:hypothetical protein
VYFGHCPGTLASWDLDVFSGARNHLLVRGAGHVPGLKRLPLFKLLAIAEIAVLAAGHVNRLTPAERKRAVDLIMLGRGRPGNLTAKEREELAQIVAKTQPRLFAGLAADKLSPVPLPKRFVHGRSKK